MKLGQVKRWFGEALSSPAPAAKPGDGRAVGDARPVGMAAAPESLAALSIWHPSRLALVEKLWGEGFVHPGGAEELLHLVNPMGLSGADTLLLLGAGPFGAARSITAARQCWVEGYERDPDLLSLALHRAELSGLKKRAPTHLLAPTPQFRAKSASHALCWQALPDDQAVAPLLAGVAAATRPGGQLAMVELVMTDHLDTPAAQRWLQLEHRPVLPPRAATISAELKHLGFDVRIVEDISAGHVAQAMGGWQTMLGTIGTHRPDHKQAWQMVGEAEMWLLRVKLLQAGRLRLMRWQAIRR